MHKKAKTADSMALSSLCTSQLWRQSLDAGKGNELMDTFEDHPEGKRVLSAAFPDALKVVAITMGGPDGIFENLSGMVPIDRMPLWLALIINVMIGEKSEKYAKRSRMGGISLEWSEQSDAVEWMTTLMSKLNGVELERLLKGIGLEPDFGAPDEDDEDDEDEDGEDDEDDEDDLDEKMSQWVDNNIDRVEEAMLEKLEEYFDETSLRGEHLDAPQMLTAQEVKDYNDQRINMLVVVSICINTEDWQ